MSFQDFLEVDPLHLEATAKQSKSQKLPDNVSAFPIHRTGKPTACAADLDVGDAVEATVDRFGSGVDVPRGTRGTVVAVDERDAERQPQVRFDNGDTTLVGDHEVRRAAAAVVSAARSWTSNLTGTELIRLLAQHGRGIQSPK